MALTHKQINRKHGIMPVSKTLWEYVTLDNRELRLFFTVQCFSEKGLTHLFLLSVNGWTTFYSENLADVIIEFNKLAEEEVIN